MRKSPALCAVLSAVCLLAGCTIWPQHPVNNWPDATGGEGLERSFWHDVKAKDWKELERHLAGNYVWVTPTARLDRPAALQYLQQMQVEEYSLGDLQSELNGNTFVVSYSMILRGTMQGKPLAPEPVRMMTVWQRQKSGWMAIAHSATAAETQPGAGPGNP
jgi:ketosteroid isomerase-like protein